MSELEKMKLELVEYENFVNTQFKDDKYMIEALQGQIDYRKYMIEHYYD